MDAHTGERIAELTADTAGPLLTGAEREVFERSAFMGQAALPVDGSPALEKRIAGLLSSGLEEVSFSQVERQLKDWQNRRKHNRTGLIPRLEEEIQAETERLARFSRARGQQEEGLRDLDLLKAEKARLEQEKAAHKALAEQKKGGGPAGPGSSEGGKSPPGTGKGGAQGPGRTEKVVAIQGGL